MRIRIRLSDFGDPLTALHVANLPIKKGKKKKDPFGSDHLQSVHPSHLPFFLSFPSFSFLLPVWLCLSRNSFLSPLPILLLIDHRFIRSCLAGPRSTRIGRAMDDMSGLLAHNFGIRPQGKSAPMAASKTASTHRSVPSAAAWSHSPSASYDDIFNPPTAAAPSPSSPPLNANRDPILDTFNKGPVFDTPVYDEDDIFNGIPGIKSSSNLKYDDVFASGTSDRSRVASPPPYDDLLGNLGKGSADGPAVRRQAEPSPPAYDDFLGGLGMGQKKDRQDRASAETKDQGLSDFDDLIPGFGSSSPPSQPKREAPRETELPKAAKATTQNDPFFDVGSGASFTDPLDHLTTKPEAAVKADASSPTTNDAFFSENPNSFDSMPSFTATSESNQNANNRSPLDDFENMTQGTHSGAGGPSEARHRSVGSDGSDPFAENNNNNNNNNNMYAAADGSSEHSETGDDVWLTVSEIPLFTKPTSAPPPSRPPPPLSVKHNYGFQRDDDLDERFGFDDGEMERSSAAMKDAMSKAEMKFKHAKVVREKMAKSKEAEQQDDEREKAELEKEEREKERRRIERERMEERKRAEKEREGARRAVERATREARERAANDAMVKAQRAAVMKAQQEARERAVLDARERAAQEAREKASAEVARERERAEREAKERADREKEVKERAERAERERRMQRAAVEKAAAEARERLAQAAKEKHQQTQTRKQSAAEPTPPRVPPPPSQPQPHDDFDSIFGMGGSRSSSVPKKNPTPPQESFLDPQSQNRTTASAANIRKTASTANMMDDLSAIFGGAPSSSGEFQEKDGETEERRNARFTREMRTRDRAAKALAEKNARDMQAQHEQDERHRISETLDFEIKRWAAGKEGNLRSLLSSLHYILWPECGWQPVSMADLITGASVKKVYRKATLCIHPDKVQQKGATLQQKYIAEKVFDILKEAWNKFNSEELF
ncbi:hypothetical protein LUZ60_014149 [Juncus effusus]|nr:hypothetical protein LUZ60_014149 [Juncus effusus]